MSTTEQTEGNLEEAPSFDSAKERDDTTEAAVKPEYTLEILPLIKEAQNQHGLRHGDHQRYRMYCTRRLRRIRKSLHFTQGQGHRHRFLKKTVSTKMLTDVRFLYIPLVSAERAWAMAMELKQESNTEPRKRFHLLRRLNKAVKHSSELVQLCEESGRCDARTKLEAQAYHHWNTGNVKFEQQQWQEALDAFGQCQTIYRELGGAVSEDQQAIYQQRVDEIFPNVRYCAYNIGDTPADLGELLKLRSGVTGSEMLASKIDEVLAQTQEKTAISLTDVQWNGRLIPVKNERVRLSLVKLQQMSGDLRREEGPGKMNACESLLMECQDAMQLVRDELYQDSSEKKRTQKSEQQRGNLQSLLDYLTHMKLTTSVQRNLLLLENLQEPRGAGQRATKPEEFVRVYDILLQHLSELADLVSSDDLAKQKQFIAQTYQFKAFRCFHLADSYAMMKKWPESLGLLERAGEHVTQALEHHRECGQEGAEGEAIKLQQLQNTIRGKRTEVRVSSILESQGLEQQMADLSLFDKPLTERLHVFCPTASPKDTVYAPFPPDYRPMPGKPLFFDLALNHIEFPSLAHRVEKKEGGITGFVKGLLWGGNK